MLFFKIKYILFLLFQDTENQTNFMEMRNAASGFKISNQAFQKEESVGQVLTRRSLADVNFKQF